MWRFKYFCTAFLCGCLIILTLVSYVPMEVTATHRENDILLAYDDRYEFSSEIASIESISVSSFQLGSERYDKRVLKKVSKTKVAACGCGTAYVFLADGSDYNIEVKPAKINLFLFVGQSNMEGCPSELIPRKIERKQTILCEVGTVYSTYLPSRKILLPVIGNLEVGFQISLDKVKKFIPSSLTKNSTEKKWRNTNNLTYAKGATAKLGIDSSFAHTWYDETGQKVWIINSAAGDTAVSEWMPTTAKKDNWYWRSVTLYQEAEKLLDKEVAAGHYELIHKGLFWYQGESDGLTPKTTYRKSFLKMWKSYQKDLGVGFCGIFMPRSMIRDGGGYFDNNGPRTFFYEITKDSKYPKIFLASDIEELWRDDVSVENYFFRSYADELEYNREHPTKRNNRMPTSCKQVGGYDHFTQLARNEIGKDGANNTIRYIKKRYGN